ncbi:MAG: NVEALA domain-containing protein [Bacteroidales bacterium]|nr:NVEALA domain-containing protein [Bacteroidales bacterium]
MRKKFLVAVGAAIVTAAVSVFVYVNNEKDSMDDLFFANVEALARGEESLGKFCVKNGKPGTVKRHDCKSCRMDSFDPFSYAYCK